jgi:2,3-bisphosphoglycerate-independent phosphoglycerate mutase
MPRAARRLVLVFLDGVGLGERDPAINPLASAWPSLEALAGRRWTLAEWGAPAADGVVVRALDAGLGFPGLPQSATGQTSLLTGRNAVHAMRGHYGPWPGPTLRALLEQGSLFHDGVAAGGAMLANVYPPGYFAALRGRSLRRSAPVHAAVAAGLPLASVADYDRGDAVAADLDGGFFRAAGSGSTAAGLLDPFDRAAVGEQAERLARLASRHAFTFFDVWLTDQVGHRSDLPMALALLRRLDAFLGRLAASLSEDVTLVVTSDHGNLEDVRTSRHSRAPVPLLARGRGAGAFAAATSLLDVAGGVRAVLAGP